MDRVAPKTAKKLINAFKSTFLLHCSPTDTFKFFAVHCVVPFSVNDAHFQT